MTPTITKMEVFPVAVNAIDTHWIWQEGSERLTMVPPQIVDGCIKVSKKPCLVR